MKSKINVKARLDRHLRIAKENISWTNESIKSVDKNKNNYHLHMVLWLLCFIPFYPELSFIVYWNNKTEFDRWNIDKDSILESYYSWDEDWFYDDVPLMESFDSFISINSILSDERDLEWTVDRDIIDYKVEAGDSISVIADRFWITMASIYSANNFTSRHTIRPWDTIKIVPVSWVMHKVEKWETLSSIAKSYKVDEEKILTQNGIQEWNKLIVWEELMIPWGVKKVKKPAYKKPAPTYTQTKKSWGYSFAKYASSQYVNKTWKYKLVWRKPFSWVAWNCTWYVASYKNVDWRWNANRWLRNAKAKWHATWSAPKIWSIVQLTGKWYNPRYGHVAIVMDITKTHIIVSDMNYRRLYEVTYRKIPINDRSIDWYIYVD